MDGDRVEDSNLSGNIIYAPSHSLHKALNEFLRTEVEFHAADLIYVQRPGEDTRSPLDTLMIEHMQSEERLLEAMQHEGIEVPTKVWMDEQWFLVKLDWEGGVLAHRLGDS